MLVVARAVLVASFMDAWIEISLEKYTEHIDEVASFMDAWIEISIGADESEYHNVASFMDAWIEMFLPINTR